MKVIGRRTKMRRGESVVIHFDVYLDNDKQQYYTIPEVTNAYIVVSVKSNYYHNLDFYNLNIWVPVIAGAECSFDVSFPSLITHEWAEQQYSLSINMMGGTDTIHVMQGLFESLYKDDWRFDEDDIPSDFDTLYKMIEFKDPSLVKGFINRPLAAITYNEPLASNRMVLVDD